MSASESTLQDCVALLFPGQGSQFPGMGDLIKSAPMGRELLDRADSVLGYSISSIMSDDDGTLLNRTVYTQPAIFVFSVVLTLEIQNRIPLRAVAAAGHSLGEYSALCAAGALSFEDALQLIRIRARAMDEAQQAGACGMAAVIGLPVDEVRRLVEDCRETDVLEAANFNAPDQIVISGHSGALERVVEAAKKLKRVKVVILPVSSAFHTVLMEPARAALRRKLNEVKIEAPCFPVIANTNAQPYPISPDEIRRLLYDQVVRPVLWEDSMRAIMALKPDSYVEIGPGKVLSGLLRRMDRTLSCINISDFSGLSFYPGYRV